AQFVELLHHHLGVDEHTALRRAVEALEWFRMPAATRRLSLYPHELPEAQRWRAVLALAVAAQPAVLLADAPAAALDPTQRAWMLDRLAGWAREHGTALVLAGRTEKVVAGPADRALLLEAERLRAASPSPATDGAVNREPPPAGAPALSVRDLRVAFRLGRTWKGEDRWLTVVDGVGFDLAEGDTLALIGESGSGKSVLARALLRLVPPSGGQVAWLGRDLAGAPPDAMRRARRDLQILFPDPAAAFDPGMTVGAQMAELLETLRPDIPAADRGPRIADALREVGLHEAVAALYPAALDTAEAAHAGLARALLSEPRLLVCDEPAATLAGADRATFLARLMEVRRRRRLALVYATEDAADALKVGRRALVLLLGRIVEAADSASLIDDGADGARHPLTRAMLAVAGGGGSGLPGDPPSALAPPSGCALRLRCPLARDHCAQVAPALDGAAAGHRIACHYWETNSQGAS
ncbi:oligopeptide/dipeptide ABC transporter ATP-binding protein, partial [Azospirillum canadense]|uniref:oligopeptide/dipeptide ABC transporter ATP-binding protein n=1 Tax=Azospirillum canadense TaxID=403962 RepID=UPI0022261611